MVGASRWSPSKQTERGIPTRIGPSRLSFPLFFRNAIQYLGGAAEIESQPSVQTRSTDCHSCDNKQGSGGHDPDGDRSEVERGADNAFTYQETDLLGVYQYAIERPMQDKTAPATPTPFRGESLRHGRE